MAAGKVVVLLVEDDQDHAELVMRYLTMHPVASRVFHVTDGQQALDYMFHTGGYSKVDAYPVPQVILLDLRLPKVDGIEVLRTLKNSQPLDRIPIVVLTTSGEERDIAAAYSSKANSYVIKPLDSATFGALMKDLGFYWLEWNQPPVSGSGPLRRSKA